MESGTLAWTVDGQQVYDPCASLRPHACRELSPKIMDMSVDQTIHNFANNLVYSKYLGWLSAEAKYQGGCGCLTEKQKLFIITVLQPASAVQKQVGNAIMQPVHSPANDTSVTLGSGLCLHDLCKQLLR